jgi:type I restriction enzyme S subunit
MIEGKIIHDPRVTVDEQTWRRLKRHALAAGDMIFARRGELGRCAIVTEGQEGWLCGTGSLKVKLGKQLDAEYAYLLITSPGVVSELSLESKGSTMENLNTETLGRIRLPLPPVNEQKAILEHVNNVAGQFGELIYTAENGIRLMVERRSALISAAVTGKIDVRNWQPPAGQYPAGDTQNRTEPEVV